MEMDHRRIRDRHFSISQRGVANRQKESIAPQQPVHIPNLDSHPINGTREWGVEKMSNGDYQLYTRAAARDDTTVGLNLRKNFAIEANFWRGVMSGAASNATGKSMAASNYEVGIDVPTTS